MKILIIFALIALNFTGYCQNVKHDMAGIPKKTNKIIINNSLTAEENYIHVGKTLVKNGYGLKTSNKDFGIFETEPKNMKRAGNVLCIFNVSISDSNIVLTGKYYEGISSGMGYTRIEAKYEVIKYWGRGVPYVNNYFYEMMDIAHKLGDNFKYVIE